jgi:hypothetical protein
MLLDDIVGRTIAKERDCVLTSRLPRPDPSLSWIMQQPSRGE